MKRASLILIPVLTLLVVLSGTTLLTAPTAELAAILPQAASALANTPTAESPHQASGAHPINSTNPSAPTRWATVVGGNEKQRDAVDWALRHFDDADLELPELVIAIYTSDEPCDGFDGAYRSRETPARLDVCNPHRLIILHELAHAWDRHTLTDGLRQDFMDLRGLNTWNDPSTPWKERGIEDLAEVVVWGLRQFSGSASQDEQPEKKAAFALVTGISLSETESEIVSAADTTVDHDRTSDDTDWDSLH